MIFQELYLKQPSDKLFHAVVKLKEIAVERSKNNTTEELLQAKEAYELVIQYEDENLSKDEYVQRQYQQYLELNSFEIVSKILELIKLL